MKVIVDIKNKTLTMLENERSIFKGEYSADKLELYINKRLENEYPVITGLLSNGRRIGAFTTDDGYEMETIDGVEYTKAKFTLSKENGFPLSAGVTQITIWMYRTKDSVLVSKEAIGNVVFTVVDTTAFNDGDIIISGDVEGTVVNLKVELENLQGRLEQYLPLSGAKAMTGNLKMKGHNIIFDNGKEETIKIGEGDDGYSMAIRIQDNDYYKSKYTGSGFSIGNDYIDATLDISESKFEMSFKDDSQTSMRPDGFSVRKEGETFYNDGEITRYPDNSYLKHVEIKLPNKSGEFALKEDIPTKASQLTNDSNYATTNQLFSKNYNDLTNKPSIPTKTSQLTNNSGFITNAVNNLTNYYLKSETYTKSEVQQLLSTISSLKLEVVTNLPTTNISSNTIYLKPLDSAKENNIYEEYIYINSKWETIGTTAVDLSNYALKKDIPTKTSELTNDSNFLTKHQDISGKADKTELDNYLPYTTGTADNAKNIYWTTRLNSFQLDIESTKPSIEFYGDRVGSATITPNKIELNGNSESGTASILLDGKPVALQENIPTKLSQLEQDVELGVSEEDVMGIIENNAEQTNTLDVGTSETFDATSDEQIPTSKAVSDLMAGASGGSKLYRHQITLGLYGLKLTIISDQSSVYDVALLTEYLNTRGHIGDVKGLFLEGYPGQLTEGDTTYLMYGGKIYINNGNGKINSNGEKVSITMNDTTPSIKAEKFTIVVSSITDRVFEL